LPKKEATTYLVSLGVSERFIQQVLDLKDLEREQFEWLIAHSNAAVRYFIAKNPSLPKDLYYKLMADPDEFVRQGAAGNAAIDIKEAVILSHDKSMRVKGVLVGNPSVDEFVILDIRRQNPEIPLVQFAMNRRCPEKIKHEISISGDSEAKYWLANGGTEP